jgi:hypothetical protein
MSPKGKSKGPNVSAGSPEARKTASAILEVLAGTITPSDAASAIGISMPKYYMLEARALNSMIEACEPRSKGRVVSPTSRMEALEKELNALKQANARQLTLLRAARRSIGYTPKEKSSAPSDGKRHRTVKPSVRALKVIAALRKPPEPAQAEAELAGVTTP